MSCPKLKLTDRRQRKFQFATTDGSGDVVYAELTCARRISFTQSNLVAEGQF